MLRLTLLTLLATSISLAQPPAPLQFEVASVRLLERSCPMARNVTPTQITLTCTPLGAVIVEAFEVAQYQTAGFDKLGYAWYNIAATMPAGTTEAQRRVMMQNLLADRFEMKFHREMRDGSAYELTVEKSGNKLREATTDGAPEPDKPAATSAAKIADNKPDADGFPPLAASPGQINYTFLPGKARAVGNAAPLSKLLDLLESGFVNGPITDNTGLTGKYDFRLDFQGPEFNMILADGTVRPTTATDFFPPIPSALSKQLGLHLERKKLPIEFLVLDSISVKPKKLEVKAPREN